MNDVIKISTVNDLSLKSFKNYTGPADKFDRSNIFFAPNGNGKTSLANGIKDEYVKFSPIENLRIYDKNFIEEHLLLKEDRNIRGVKADFGKKDVDLEKKIKRLEEEIEALTGDLLKLSEDNSKLVKITETAIDDIFKRRKGRASIAKKSHKDGVHEKVVSLWIDEYEAALKRFPDEKYDEIDGEKNFGDNLDVINGLRFDVPLMPSEYELKLMSVTAAKTYDKVDIPSSEIITWLETGLHIHENKQTCEFCGNSINIKDISSRIDAFIKNEQSVDRKQLDLFKNKLQLIYGTVKSIADKREATIASLEQSKKAIAAFDNLAEVLEPLASFGSAIGTKINTMSESVNIDLVSLSSLLDKITAAISELSETKNNLKKHYEEKINRLETLVKGAIGFEVSGSELISGNVSTYVENKRKITDFTENIKKKRVEIRTLRDSKSDLADFANYLNMIFEEIGVNFRLVLSGKSYVLRHSLLGINLTIDDISEGECNLLALVYFYYEMLGEDQKNLKDSIEVVIIDDPVTSMDDENRFYILELVKSVIDNKSLQSFILTHSWHDYCDLSYGKNEQQGIKKFEITKVNGESAIEKSRSELSPYRKLYKEVYDFSQKTVNDVTADEALHMPNTMRRVLEEYIRFNFGIELATQAHFNEIAQALFEKDLAQISQNNEAKLKTLLSVCNILSHGAPRTRSLSEIHSSSRFLIARMNEINKYHHDKMKQA
jgi:hypothetical protein